MRGSTLAALDIFLRIERGRGISRSVSDSSQRVCVGEGGEGGSGGGQGEGEGGVGSESS